VPIAVLLSGGLDSSAVASAISYLYPNNELTAISATYKDDDLDEAKFITKVADRYKNIKLHLIEIKKDIFFRKLEQVIYHQETPIADGSMAAHFLLIEKIKELGIKVVLSGQGGDEILAGYIYTFLPAYYADKIRQLRLNYVTIRNVFHALPAVIKNRLKNSVVHNKYGKFFKKNSTLNTIKDFYKHFKNNNILNSYLLNSILYWSLPSFLHYEDRNSMAFSVENRSPYLDYRLVEFMLSLPNDFKIRKGVSKWILRESLKDILPAEIAKRKDKQGFYAPINRWNDSFPEQYLNDTNFSREFSYLNFERIKEDKIMQWRVYTLWLWHKAFIQA
jgi:asparagine synthase (glutamine-hydrolysing)